VLLAPNGGIKSSQEVKRLAGLMTKFSKKLVSKCIYIQILKCTETELLGQFMTAGGWTLTHMWLTDGILTRNWSLVQELLELLLLCPVDVMRLKSNSAPKLVKSLSKDSAHEGEFHGENCASMIFLKQRFLSFFLRCSPSGHQTSRTMAENSERRVWWDGCGDRSASGGAQTRSGSHNQRRGG
jgi:hypothetical protein